VGIGLEAEGVSEERTSRGESKHMARNTDKLERLPNPFQIIPLEKHLESLDMGPFDRGERPRDHLYASELGYCPRAVWLGFKHPKPIDKEFSETRGALGHAIEELMAVKLARILVAREVTFRDERVSGRVDFVVRLKKGDPQIPVELKTTYAYTRFCANPEMSHLLQLGWYLTQMPEAPFGILIYYALDYPNSAHWTAIEIPHDDRFVEERVKRLWKIAHALEEPACENPGENARGERRCFSCSTHEGERGPPI
jgi:CRISPR/Cas system-associated exonuclease Cas4 (RecB family)